MARPRRYETDAAKQAAYRERKLRELELSEGELVYAASETFETPDGAVATIAIESTIPVALISEQEYVAREVQITREQINAGRIRIGLIGDKPDPVREAEDRIARSERYARERYRAFLAGEVASL